VWRITPSTIFQLALAACRQRNNSNIARPRYNEDNHKVNVENTKITTENISISVSQLQIKQRN